MVFQVDPSTANIQWTTRGARAACHPGKNFALLHCSRGANLGAGDTLPAGKIPVGDAMTMEASVFVEASPDELDFGAREFGMVQVTELFTYSFLYAGRVSTEGSSLLDMKRGFKANPSLDVETNTGQSIDERIFDPTNMTFTKVTTPRSGFNIKVRFGDHPSNSIPNQFENRVAGAPNFLARAERRQHFVVFFVTRKNTSSPITVLGRLGWAVVWIVDFNWTADADKPTATMRESNLFPGQFLLGAAADGEPWSNIAINRTEPTTNSQDNATVDAVYVKRMQPMVMQSKTWPEGFRTDFFK